LRGAAPFRFGARRRSRRAERDHRRKPGRSSGRDLGDGPNEGKIAAGGPGELGRLEALAHALSARADAEVLQLKAGSGAGMAVLRRRKVDMALTFAAERQAADR
jgi:hypothetical protein